METLKVLPLVAVVTSLCIVFLSSYIKGHTILYNSLSQEKTPEPTESAVPLQSDMASTETPQPQPPAPSLVIKANPDTRPLVMADFDILVAYRSLSVDEDVSGLKPT